MLASISFDSVELVEPLTLKPVVELLIVYLMTGKFFRSPSFCQS
jgi:hypothetical protein